MQGWRGPKGTAQRIFVLSCIMAILFPNVRCACVDTDATRVEITNSNITDIPLNLGPHIKFLKISNTDISILNLTVAVGYPVMCRFEIHSSPVKIIVTPKPPQVVALTAFKLAAVNFPIPPDLGPLLAGQLEHLYFEGIGIISIPENYFQNYTNLISLSLNDNPIYDLNAGNMAGLRHLHSLYLSRAPFRHLPSLHLWVPKLQRLHVTHMVLIMFPASMLANLTDLRFLDLTENQLSTIPDQDHFVNIDNMGLVTLTGNPLNCDSRLCWMKVTSLTNAQI